MEYKIQSIQTTPEGYFLTHISLDIEKKHIIVLKFMNGFIKHLASSDSLTEEIESKLRKMLLENDNLLLIRLTRIALGNESIKKQLRNKENGILDINYSKWQRIIEKLKQEREDIEKANLELILAQGIEDL